jgi:CBS domain-containing protein
MRLQDFMSKNVDTIPATESAEKAWDLMRFRRIHHLVVTRDRTAVGVLSDRDLGGFRGGKLREKKSVSDLMTPHLVSATGQTTVRQAANLMRGCTIGCLPVYDKGELAGIVTISDLLELIGRGAERPRLNAERWTLRVRPGRRRKGGRGRTG